MNQRRYNFIKSSFTRKRGYIDIQSSTDIDHKEAISILSTFTPQGASPPISLRIGSYNSMTGASFYYMENQNEAKISAFLWDHRSQKYQNIQLPFDEEGIKSIAKGDHKMLFSSRSEGENILKEQFSVNEIGSILYSILAGDNVIIVHNSHQMRLNFLFDVLKIVPSMIFSYNQVTSECAELDGNENIIGVAKLPKKYRSHKKMYMELDTIFVDLEQGSIQGEGLKKSAFSTELATMISESEKKGQKYLVDFMKTITKPHLSNYLFEEDAPTQALVSNIRKKLGLSENTSEDWLMTF